MPDMPHDQIRPELRRLPPGPTGSMRQLVREPLRYFLTMTQEYGDIVRYRPAPEPAYLVNHPEYIKHVLVLNNRNYTKDTYINAMFKSAVANGLLTSEGEVWRQQRRLMQPAFHHQRIENLSRVITGETLAVLEQWETLRRQGQPVDIAGQMSGLTLSITGKVLFGVDLGERAKLVGQMVNMGAALLEKPRHPRFQEGMRALEQVVLSIIAERRQSSQDTGDLLSILITQQDEETGVRMDDQQLRDQVVTLLLAGYETTANALTWTWYLLAQHPESMEKLRVQAWQALGTRLPAHADLAAIPYALMVFQEGMRMYPPAWILGRRAVADDEIGGYLVPANTIVAVSPYTMHRHPAFWENPERYEPERFSEDRSAGRHHFAYLPFGAGPRQCIGNYLALLEAQLILITITQRYRLRLLPDQDIHPEPLFILRPNREILMEMQPV